MERLTINPARGLAWAALSFAVFVAALFATLPILAVVNWLNLLGAYSPVGDGGAVMVGAATSAGSLMGGAVWL